MNITAHAQRLFIFLGLILVAIAAIQLLMRPRRQAKPAGWFDATTVRAIFFIAVGLVVVLAGVGVIPLPGGR
ncbi:MAG: hypothetical protein JXP73_18530 [Deltaproteobacteria bacterium]|jgi:hypothetical protein|nr:hypothetical protein [Deltaproteobacteria bacterium]